MIAISSRASLAVTIVASTIGVCGCGSDASSTERDEVKAVDGDSDADDDTTDDDTTDDDTTDDDTTDDDTTDDDDATPAPANPKPEVVLPEGEEVSSVVAYGLSSLAYDSSGVLWAVNGCSGAYAITSDRIVRYGWIDSELPSGANYVVTDSRGRRWFYGWSEVAVLDGTEWTHVHTGDHEGLSVAQDGTAWVLGLESVFAVDLDYSKREVPLPDRALSIAAESVGAVWVSTTSGIYRWDGSDWLGPVGDIGGLAYDAEADAAWALDDPAGLVRVEDDQLVWDEMPAFPSARFVGFDSGGQMVFAGDDVISWYDDGAKVDQSGAALGPNPVAAVAPDDGVVYLVPDARVVKWTDGDAERDVVQITDFDEATAFPWRATDYAEVRSEPSMDVTVEQLEDPDSSMIGKKLRMVGHLEHAFEWSGINVEGTTLPYWVDMAPQFGQVSSDLELSLSVSVDGTAEQEEPPSWEIFAYLETGYCFGHLSSSLAQLYIVEAYPLENAEQAAEIRERLDALP